MKNKIGNFNKELNSSQVEEDDMDDDEYRERKECAIYDNGDINSKANRMVFDINRNKNLNDEEKAALLKAHDDAMMELKLAMDSDRKKQEKEMDKAL